MGSVFTILPAALPVPAVAGGVSAPQDVRQAGGPLTFNCDGNQGDKIRVQGSPDGANLWGDVCVLNNKGSVQTPVGTAFGYVRLVRDVVDPSPGVVLVVPQVSVTAQPAPPGYGFQYQNIVIPAGDGVSAAYNLSSLALTAEVDIGAAKSIVCSAFDPGDTLTLEAGADGNAPWVTVMNLQQGKILAVPTSIGFVRIRRARVPAAGPRVGVDGATAAFMGNTVSNPTGAITPVVGNYNAAYGDIVMADPTAVPMNVTLPPAGNQPSGRVQVFNKSDSANLVSVSAAGPDTINGLAGPVDLAARESLVLVSDGVSDWMIF